MREVEGIEQRTLPFTLAVPVPEEHVASVSHLGTRTGRVSTVLAPAASHSRACGKGPHFTAGETHQGHRLRATRRGTCRDVRPWEGMSTSSPRTSRYPGDKRSLKNVDQSTFL